MIQFHRMLSLALLIMSVVFQISLGYHDGAYQWNNHINQQIEERTVQYTKLEDVSPVMVQMMVMKEDRRFYMHEGFDPTGMARAMVLNVKAGKWKAGGSTITQQVVKNLFLSADKTLERKVRELIIAVKLDLTYSKNDILEMYLNVAYFGEDAYGIGSAAQKYYHKAPADLTQDEAATLVGLLPAPSVYNPVADPDGAKVRAKAVKELMSTPDVKKLLKAYREINAIGFNN